MGGSQFKTDIINKVKIFNHDSTQLLHILKSVQDTYRYIPSESYKWIADELKLTPIDVEGVAHFYHFFSTSPRGKITIYCNTSATAEMMGGPAVIKEFTKQLGLSLGETTRDGWFGLYPTSCIGMSDQEPALIINDVVFTRMTPQRVKHLLRQLKKSKKRKNIQSLIHKWGDGNNSHPLVQSEVMNHIQRPGPVFFNSTVAPGTTMAVALKKRPEEIIEEINKSNLRGRGGAGFPTGKKWGFCRATPAPHRYVICNADEGEPGTFKDRVLLTEKPELIFEGMVLAGYAIGATHGILYLRAEYIYLKKFLQYQIDKMRSHQLLGENILGSGFNFDIEIKMGAGAYICGEESALIESAEGKRGEPRNRPPFPVVSGYKGAPTIVNNPETYGCAMKIIQNGAEWFRKMGTSVSSGVKLFSISGDCERPGVYELEWGKSMREVLELCGAKDVLAIQVGGPSGVCISKNQIDRKLCYSDLSTGGAITIFNTSRNLLSILHNHMDFFVKESCGFCVPCRAGNSLILKCLEKIMSGNGSFKDLEELRHVSHIVRSASRCGLGQSSPNPILTSLENFDEIFKSYIHTKEDFTSSFDLDFATREYSDNKDFKL